MSMPSLFLLVDDNFRQGLALDVSVLRALIVRHRCNHGRTLYFRRLVMVLRSFEQTYDIMHALSRLQSLQKDMNQFHQDEEEQRRKNHRNNNNKRCRQTSSATDEHWSLYPTQTNQGGKGASPSMISSSPINDAERLLEEMRQLIGLWTKGIPEIVSRIHHASRALFLEVSRGFFLPFCSVALATLARIRSMLMIVGRLGLTQLVQGIQSDMMAKMMTTTGRPVEPMVSDDEYAKVITYFLDDDQSGKNRKTCQGPVTWLRKSDMESLLISLGLQPSRVNVSLGNLNDDNETADVDEENQDSRAVEDDVKSLASSMPYQDEQNESSPMSLGIEVDNNLQNYLEEEDAVDLGESIDYVSTVTEGDAVKQVGRSTASSSTGAIDQNMALVDSFQSKRKKIMTLTAQKNEGKNHTLSSMTSTKDELKQTSKMDRSLELASPPLQERPKKEKKKAKKRKANFFDDLFDS